MLSGVLRILFLWLARRRWLAHLALAVPLFRRLPYRFVAGTTLDDAVVAVRRLNAQGAMVTLDVLGESVTDRATALRAADEYVAAIDRIASEGLDSNVSLKLTQMGLDAGVDVCLEALSRVLEAGRRHGIFVRIDMESYQYVDRTLDIADRMRAQGFDVGVVIQSYLRRSQADVERLAAERVRVRVCKGAYAEPPDVAFTNRGEIDANYLTLATRLLDADAYPAIATHDSALIDAVARYAAERGIGPDRYEFQMLYGIRRDLQQRLVARGHRVRVYVPFGTEWFPYFMRRLGERPANVLFVLRSLIAERGGEEHPLQDSETFATARRYEQALRRWSAGERPATRLGTREANRLVREATELQRRLRTSPRGRAAVERLMADADRLVRVWAATHVLGWNPAAARPVLERLRDDGRQGARDAALVLQQYEDGTLDLD
ncbi:MAG: proline dehydrogenase family protein [Chloroflexota bacterium]|nr:proline dehydrogenase family protein [Chloroflexota bacterium]